MTQYRRPSSGESEYSAASQEQLSDDALLGRADSSDDSIPVASAAGELVVTGAVGWGCEALHPSVYSNPFNDAGSAAGGVS